jgi:hypothetical protein
LGVEAAPSSIKKIAADKILFMVTFRLDGHSLGQRTAR